MSAEVGQEDQFKFLEHLHKAISKYAFPRNWESLWSFENHVTLKFADSEFIPFDEASRLHDLYHESQDDRLREEFR